MRQFDDDNIKELYAKDAEKGKAKQADLYLAQTYFKHDFSKKWESTRMLCDLKPCIIIEFIYYKLRYSVVTVQCINYIKFYLCFVLLSAQCILCRNHHNYV